MKYRTDLLGGSLDIRKGDKSGTVVTCIFSAAEKLSKKRLTIGT